MPKRRDANAPYWQQLRAAERSVIVFALEHGETIRGTAAILGISPNFLSERIRELGIKAPEVRPGPKPGSKPAPRLRVVRGGEPKKDDVDADVPINGTPVQLADGDGTEGEDEDDIDEDEDEDEDEEDEDEDEDEDEEDEDEADDQDQTWADDAAATGSEGEGEGDEVSN